MRPESHDVDGERRKDRAKTDRATDPVLAFHHRGQTDGGVHRQQSPDRFGDQALVIFAEKHWISHCLSVQDDPAVQSSDNLATAIQPRQCLIQGAANIGRNVVEARVFDAFIAHLCINSDVHARSSIAVCLPARGLRSYVT